MRGGLGNPSDLFKGEKAQGTSEQKKPQYFKETLGPRAIMVKNYFLFITVDDKSFNSKLAQKATP